MKLVDVFFCDDIRYEVNNKLSLMGLYNDRIVLRARGQAEIKWPVAVNLSILLRFDFSNDKRGPDHFTFEYTVNGKSVTQATGDMTVTPDQSFFNLALPGVGIPLELGNLGFDVKLYKKKDLLFAETRKEALKILEEREH